MTSSILKPREMSAFIWSLRVRCQKIVDSMPDLGPQGIVMLPRSK